MTQIPVPPLPIDCIGQKDVTPAMRNWMNQMALALQSAQPAPSGVTSDGAVLMFDSFQPTGIKATPFPAGAIASRNVLYNGDFAVWQRGIPGAIGAIANANIADRWQAGRSGAVAGATVSRGLSGGSIPGLGYVRLQRMAGDASTAALQLGQSLESLDSAPLAGQFVTLSFGARAGANFSAANATLGAQVQTGTGNSENVLLGYTGQAIPINGTSSITTNWARYSFSALLAANTNELGVVLYYVPTGVAGANDFVDIAAVQLEVSPLATAFEYRPFAEQLARCQRYFQKSFPYGVTPAQNAGNAGMLTYRAQVAGTAAGWIAHAFLRTMRATPAITFYNPAAANANWRNYGLGADSGAASAADMSDCGFDIQNPQVAGDRVGDAVGVHWTADAEL